MLLGYAKAGLFRLDLSEDILNETARVLRDKFRRDGYSIHESDQRLRSIGNRVTPTEKLDVVKEDPDDNRILECARAARSDYIVSEDKDLLRLGNFEGAPVVTIREFHATSFDTASPTLPKFID